MLDDTSFKLLLFIFCISKKPKMTGQGKLIIIQLPSGAIIHFLILHDAWRPDEHIVLGSGDWIAAISWVQMAMKKCASHPGVLYAQSEEWSKDKCGPGWCWISSDPECPELFCAS
jgi:hypothetical protein